MNSNEIYTALPLDKATLIPVRREGQKAAAASRNNPLSLTGASRFTGFKRAGRLPALNGRQLPP
jgi:hypothetical protein